MLRIDSGERSSAEWMWMTEDAAREFPNLPLRMRCSSFSSTRSGGRRSTEAALRWLERYLEKDRRGFSTSRRSRRAVQRRPNS